MTVIKKLISIILIVLILTLYGCQPRVYEYDGSVSADSFSIVVCGTEIDGTAMVGYPFYGCKAVSVNSYGTKTAYEYVGYTLEDILKAAGVSSVYETVTVTGEDGYSVDFSAKETNPKKTLIALQRDGSNAFSPIFAPCGSDETSSYVKIVSEISVK